MFRWISRYVKRIDVMGVGIELREIPEEEAIPFFTSAPPPASYPSPAPKSSMPNAMERPLVEKQDFVRVIGRSASSRGVPREIDLMVDDHEIQIHIHQPGGAQPMLWVDRNLLQQTFDEWRKTSSGIGRISVAARTTRNDAEVVFVADDSDEVEVQAGWWIWVPWKNLKVALAELGVRTPW